MQDFVHQQYRRKVVNPLLSFQLVHFVIKPSEGGFSIARNSCPAGKLLENSPVMWFDGLMTHMMTPPGPPPKKKAEQSSVLPVFGGIGIFFFWIKRTTQKSRCWKYPNFIESPSCFELWVSTRFVCFILLSFWNMCVCFLKPTIHVCEDFNAHDPNL